jgi:hypothetical protein
VNFHDGLYDEVVSNALWGTLSNTTNEHERTVEPLLVEDVSERLADVLVRQLVRILDDLGGDGQEKARQQLELVNSILTIMKSLSSPRKMKDTVREAVERGRSNF